MTNLLEIRNLSVHFDTDYGEIEAVDDVGFEIGESEIFGLVGESGSGKSVTTTAVLKLVRKPGRIVRGSIVFRGEDLCQLPEERMRGIRGAQIAMISQTPRTALNPVLTVGKQLSRLYEFHGGLKPADAQLKAMEMLNVVGIPEPARRMNQYAHQLSGGMCQRVMLGMALATSPKLLIADEPTTGLDVSIAARILDLLRDLGKQTGASILLITHDLGVVASTCERVAVMHAGQIVEIAPVRALFHHPAHPYTQALVHSIPRVDRKSEMVPIPGAVPSLLNAPPGCRYASRCSAVGDRCRKEKPKMIAIAGGHQVACFGVEEGRVRVA